MPGNGDFEAKCPGIWEFDFIKRWKHNDFLLGQVFAARHGRA
jgi:hypothetical protein